MTAYKSYENINDIKFVTKQTHKHFYIPTGLALNATGTNMT